MNSMDKPLPRFVPTLTEVVEPSGLNFTPVQTPVDVQQLARALVIQVQPVIEQMVKEEFYRLTQVFLSEQWSEMAVRLESEIDKRVHSAAIEVCTNPSFRVIQK